MNDINEKLFSSGDTEAESDFPPAGDHSGSADSAVIAASGEELSGDINDNTAADDSSSGEKDQYFDVVMEAATVGDMLSAKRRLAQLYHIGSGVAQSNAEAVRWYSLAALQAMNELTATPSLKRAESAFSILLELGELHQELGDTGRAVNTFLRMEFMLDSLPEELHSLQTDRWIQICSNKLGSLYERRANTSEAYRHFSRALETAERVIENDSGEIARDDLAVASYRVGFMDHLFRGERGLLLRAKAIWGELYDQTGKYDYRHKVNVINTLFALSDIPEAEDTGSPDEIDLPGLESTAIEPVSDRSAADTLSAELAEYIREHGYSRSGTLESLRPLLDALLIVTLAALCIWGYFSGTFHEIFRFIRNL